MRLISWNVNGLRAAIKKGFVNRLADLETDLICLQETKAQDDQVREALADLDGYHIYSNSAVKKGYSGTALLTRQQPMGVEYDMDIEEHDQEGRVIAAEFTDYYLVNVYTPNSGNGLKRLDYRAHWDRDFLAYVQDLERSKPVIVTGDFNVAHREIDLARPKANYNKTAGFTQVEIDGLDNLLATGLTDTFRQLHPDTVKYSFWSQRAGARERNVGWRIDYFLVSEPLIEKVQRADILDQIMGSDHCPILLEL